MASSLDLSCENNSSSIGQKVIRKATIDISLVYNNIVKSIRSKRELKKGEILNGRYIFIKYIGRGSFGKVIKAKSLDTSETVAIKITENLPSLHRHALQEIKTLTEIEKYDPNNGFIVKMLEYFIWEDRLCIVFELLCKTLYKLIKETNFSGICLSNVKVFAWQIIMALKFLSVPQLGIIHCDLKPENIMLVSSQKAGVKIIDFGSSCKKLSKYRYVQSRYYRAPEVLLDLPYDLSIDMWSVGCVLAELLTGKPIFAGKNDRDQLVQITNMLGPYELNECNKLSFSLRHFFLSQQNDANFENFLDLLKKMFVYNPLHRITPQQALNHPFFTEAKINIRENSLRSPNGKHKSSASSMDNSPCSKLSTGIGSCYVLSPSRQGSYTAYEEPLLKTISEVPRRTSLQP
jgi:serine/threonine protein kinase